MAVAATSPSRSMMLCPSGRLPGRTQRNGTERDGTGHPPRITEAKDAYSAPTVLLARATREPSLSVDRRSRVGQWRRVGRPSKYVLVYPRERALAYSLVYSRARTPCTVRRCGCACSAQHISNAWQPMVCFANSAEAGKKKNKQS
jgi:hypothetical protein